MLGNLKNNGLLTQKNTKERNKDGRGWRRLKRIGNDDFEKLSQFFSKYTNGHVAPLIGDFAVFVNSNRFPEFVLKFSSTTVGVTT